MFEVSALLCFIFVNSVTSGALESNFNSKIFTSESYRHNHPPSLEPHNIPYANDFEVRKNRNVEINENIKNEHIGIAETFSKSDAILDLQSSKPHEEALKLHSGNNSQVSSANNKVKRRKLRRKQNPLDDVTGTVKQSIPNLDVKDSVTAEPVSTSPSPRTVIPKTFTKRPIQFNPVPKKTWENTHTPVVKILEETNYVFGHNGNFHYSFEGADGTKVSSTGELKSFNDDKTGEAVAGEVHYKDNEGNDISLSYTADENGYRAYGAHLPTPPPIPIAIARALKHLATKSTPETITEAYNSY